MDAVIWRVSEADLTAYLDTAYRLRRERIESGQIPDGEASED
ncbi:hypothetical protein [Arthrobacter sp. UNC362MFTsu5.1]|nr:hypothetical protein [Arthrobacter sp. UNC362MFTsu5.1]